jgi:AbrB family looped-hinge helix DNA binding protein
MPTVKLHPEGWLSLPDAVRRKLGVATGDTLELQVVGNSVILRPAKGKAASAEPEPAAEEPASPIEPEPAGAAPETPAPAKRRGRPPKVRS